MANLNIKNQNGIYITGQEIPDLQNVAAWIRENGKNRTRFTTASEEVLSTWEQLHALRHQIIEKQKLYPCMFNKLFGDDVTVER